MTKIPNAPSGAGPSGRRLWRAVLADFELAEHEMALLRQAVRITDTCDRLQVVVDDEGPLVSTAYGTKAHPALVELRQQRIVLARIIVALRVPLGDQEEETAPARSQRRGLRGVYGGAA